MHVKTRLKWLDIGKGIAIILVVLGHSIPGAASATLLKQAIFSFHMPLFFIYAGYTFRRKPAKEQFISSFKRLLIPYVVLFFLNAVFAIVRLESVDLNVLVDLALSFCFASAVKNKVLGITAAGMIWFFMVLFIARLLFNALLFLFDKYEIHEVVRFVIWAVFAGIGMAAGQICHLPLSFDLVPLACLFIQFGYSAKCHEIFKGAVPTWVFLCALVVWVACFTTTPFSMGERMFPLAPVGVIGALAGTFVVTRLSMMFEKCSLTDRLLSFFGLNSMFVLCLHYIESHTMAWGAFKLLKAVPHEVALTFFIRMVFISTILYLAHDAIPKPTKRQVDSGEGVSAAEAPSVETAA